MSATSPRTTFLCLLLVFLTLSLASSQPKQDQYGGKKDETKPWWSRVLYPVEKPLRTIQSAELLLLGQKRDQGRANRGPDDVRRRPLKTTTARTSWQAIVDTKPTPARTTQPTTRTTMKPSSAPLQQQPSTPQSSSSAPPSGSTGSPLTTPGKETDSLKVRTNLRRFMEEPCGVSLESRIINGQETMPGEFPWLALLQVWGVYTHNLKFICGGTLINNRYVLTAAHCVTDFRYNLVSVRLGEYNTETEGETKVCSGLDEALMTKQELEVCRAEPPKDYPVETKIVHPEYAPGRKLPNDIALVRLKDMVEFTYYIAPVCMPIGDLSLNLADVKIGINTTVAGWGMTEKLSNSPIPLKANLPLMEFVACKRLIADMTSGKLCVGDDVGSSPCFGDSGGPIILRTMMAPFEEEETNELEEEIYTGYTRSVLLGVVSSGPGFCNVIQPTLATNVLDYIVWILQSIDP